MIKKKSQLAREEAERAGTIINREEVVVETPDQPPQEESRQVVMATNQEPRDVIRLSADIDREAHVTLKCYAAMTSQTIVAVLNKLIYNHCNVNGVR